MPIRPGEQDAQLIGEHDQSVFGDAPFVARLAVAGAGEEGRLDALGRACPQQRRVGGGRGAHEHEVDLPIGKLGDVGDRADAEHLLPLQVRAEDRTLITARKNVVQAHETELAGVRAGTGDKNSARLEQCTELLVGGAQPRRRRTVRLGRHLDQRVDRDR